MAALAFTLDDSFSWFIEERRIDPMTRARFKRGDRVVVCAKCNQVLLEDTWDECGGCVMPGCHGTAVDNHFLRRPTPRPRSSTDGINRIVLTNGAVRQARPQAPVGVGHIVVKSRKG